MIRFVKIPGEQGLVGDHKCFAWFDTVTDFFLSVGGNHIWINWTEFRVDFAGHYGSCKGEYWDRLKRLVDWEWLGERDEQ